VTEQKGTTNTEAKTKDRHRHNMYKNKNDARSRNHCCRGRARSATYLECVSIALVIEQAKRMRAVILSFCGLSGSITFSHTV
jgi:hypothetical protein